MNRNPANWDEQEIVVEKIEDGKGTVYVTYDGGWTFGVEKKYLTDFTIAKGMTGILWTSNFSTIRGLLLNDRTIFYKSRDDAARERQEMLDGFHREAVKSYNKNIAVWRTELASMHPAIRARMQRFINEKGEKNFYIDSGPYEHMICNQASLLLKLYSTVAEIEAFDMLPYKKQVALGWDDGHSGYSDSCAKGMAKAVIEGIDI